MDRSAKLFANLLPSGPLRILVLSAELRASSHRPSVTVPFPSLPREWGHSALAAALETNASVGLKFSAFICFQKARPSGGVIWPTTSWAPLALAALMKEEKSVVPTG